jgi:excisionase family DNA binding protein
MLWKTHLRISFKVLRRIGVFMSSEESLRFKAGVLAPDRRKDYPHHHGKSEAIRRNLMYARQCYLQDNLLDAFYYLGVALHYIQDAYTSMASFYPKHKSWEQDIEDSNLVYDLEEKINYYLRNNEYQRDRCLWLADALSREVQGKNNTLYVATLTGKEASKSFAKPIIDLNLGLRASYVVSKSVLSPKNCPTLETQLKDVLSHHETLLRNAEIELSDQIIRLIEERDQLINKKVPPTGIVSKIKNWITGIRIGLKDRAANSKHNDYVNKRHLENVASDYRKATDKIVTPYMGWYNYQVPQINIGIVKRDLLSIQEIAGYFGVTEYSVKELLKKGHAPSFHIGTKELIRRPQLDKILSQFPLNGFKEYPA